MAFNADEILQEFRIFDPPDGSPPLHYLDNAATTQVPDCVLRVMLDHDTRHRSNAKRGIHRLARESTEALEYARSQVAGYLGVKNDQEVVFTSGTTAGINLLALSLGHGLGPGDEILLSQLEHHSNIIPWQMLRERLGVTLRYLPVDAEGRLELNGLEEMITEKTRLVSISHGSNVTAAITEVAPIVRCAHEKGVRVLLDGAQVAPHGPLNLPALGPDYYVFSGHKVYGPSGVGILWGRSECLEPLPPAFGGGEMISHVSFEASTYLSIPHRFEAGTLPITQAIGLGAALDWLAHQDVPRVHQHLWELTDRIMAGIADIDRERGRIRILGPKRNEERLPLVSFVVEDVHPHDICQILNDGHGVAVRGGHHCAQPLHDLWDLDGSTRASLALYNREADVDALLNGLDDCMRILS